MSVNSFGETLLPDGAMNERSQRLAESKQIPEVLCGEIWPRGRRRCAFAADLNYADDSAIVQNRRADNFLDWIQAFAA